MPWLWAYFLNDWSEDRFRHCKFVLFCMLSGHELRIVQEKPDERDLPRTGAARAACATQHGTAFSGPSCLPGWRKSSSCADRAATNTKVPNTAGSSEWLSGRHGDSSHKSTLQNQFQSWVGREILFSPGTSVFPKLTKIPPTSENWNPYPYLKPSCLPTSLPLLKKRYCSSSPTPPSHWVQPSSLTLF